MVKIRFFSVILALLFVGVSGYLYAQTTPVNSYSSLGQSDFIQNGGSDDFVCPGSKSVFYVERNNFDIDNSGRETYEWVVYGGHITEINGSTASGSYVNLYYPNNVNPEVRYSFIEHTGSADISAGGYASGTMGTYIEVEWDTTHHSVVNGWVAVRQTSEYGCTDGKWSIFTNKIKNDPPVWSSFPPNIRLPYQFSSTAYTLPMPAATDDGCTVSGLTYTYTFVNADDDTTCTNCSSNSRNVNLKVGENTVIWTVSDGGRSITRSYTIIVEPKLDIMNVAWTNPHGCTDGTEKHDDNGTLLVTQVTDYDFLPELEYSIDGTTFQSGRYFQNLSAGTYSIRARLVYSVDYDFDDDDDSFTETSAVYSITLHDNENVSVSNMPTVADGEVTVSSAGCLKNNNGKISTTIAAVNELNNSVYFDGINDYVTLNKQYSSSLSKFSAAVWLKMPEAPKEGTILSFGKSDYIQLDATYGQSKSGLRLYSSAMSNVMFTYSGNSLADGRWHLVVITFDNGVHRLYVDGTTEDQPSAVVVNTIGGAVTRSGVIGASVDYSLADEPLTNFFKGYIAEVAIWDNYAVTAADVQNIRETGISNLANAPSDQWIFNDVPKTVSADPDIDTVFTDLGNIRNEEHWGRFESDPYQFQQSTDNSPKLISWTDDIASTDDATAYGPDTIISNLGVGDYTLHIKDIYGCGDNTETYTVSNSDTLGPQLYWNVALRKAVTGADNASYLTDGFYNTRITQGSSAIRINLGTRYNVRGVMIYTGTQTLGSFNVLLSYLDDINSSVASREITTSVAAGDTTYVEFENSNGANFVWIRPASGTTLPDLAEVEVYISDNIQPRKFYLADTLNSCYYLVTANDMSVKPYAYDACKGIVAENHYASVIRHPELSDGNTPAAIADSASLVGIKLAAGTDSIMWVTFDDIGKTDTMVIPYQVLDTVKPFFVNGHRPISTMPDIVTYCDLQITGGNPYLRLPIPQVQDNYTGCDTLKSMILENNKIVVFRNSTTNYDYRNFDSTDVRIVPGNDYTLVWKIEDFSGNVITDTLKVRVETQPLIRDISVAANRCTLTDNRVIFSNVQSESGRSVEYYLIKTPGEGTSADTLHNSTGIFSEIEVGTYVAYVEVNGCWSNKYRDDIVISEPNVVTFAEHVVTPVNCAGNFDGAVTLGNEWNLGGSGTQVLHWLGGADGVTASVANYSALDIDTAGTVEGWVYLDTLANADNANWNVGLFGVRDISTSTDCYGIRMVDGNVTFYVGNNSLTSSALNAVDGWYHICGRWTPTNMSLQIRNSSGVVLATSSNNGTFSAPTGGSLYMGSDGEATSPFMRGFVRAVRVWNYTATNEEVQRNLFLSNPINVNNNLVANLLLNDGGTTLQNSVTGTPAGSLTAADHYIWQRFAYHWTTAGGGYVARTKDIENMPADYYKVTLYDPMGCTTDTTIYLYLNDHSAPLMTFSNDGHCAVNLITDGGSLWRYTSDDNGSITCEIAATTVVENTIHIEAENNVTGFCLSMSTNGQIEAEGNNATNGIYFNGGQLKGDKLAFAIVGAAGDYTFAWRYALNKDYPNRSACLMIDGDTVINNIDFNRTTTNSSGWNIWDTVYATVPDLEIGYHTVVLVSNSNATGHVGLSNYDWIEVTGPNVGPADCNGAIYDPSTARTTVTIGDCAFAASNKIFDPCVSDDICPADSVKLTMEILSGELADASIDIDTCSSLDGVPISESVEIRWTATDKAGNASTYTVNYHAVDDDEPILENCPSSVFNNIDGQSCGINNDGDYVVTRLADENCEFVVPDGDLVPYYCDNCRTGVLSNNIDGGENLDNHHFSVGQHIIRWVYRDLTFTELPDIDPDRNPKSDSIEYILNVVDVTNPVVEGRTLSSVNLDETGSVTISSNDVILSESDNCDAVNYILMKNLALGGTATQSFTDAATGRDASLAIDGGFAFNVNNGSASLTTSDCNANNLKYPWWEVDLGDQYIVRRIVVHAGFVGSFHVLTSSNNVYEIPPQSIGGNWATFNFGNNVNKISYVTGTLNDGDSMIFDIPDSQVDTVRYVRIWNGEKCCLRLAEVEVYGTPINNPDQLTFTCDDIKYPKEGETNTKELKSCTNILVNAVDNAGNTTQLSQCIEVKDVTPPSVVLFSPTIALDANGSVNPNNYVGLNDNTIIDWEHTSDACGIDYATVTETDISCLEIGQVDVHVQVYDINGNYTEAVTKISVIDELPPVVTVKNPINLYVGVDGYYDINPQTDIIQTASDNCTDSANLVYSVTPERVSCSDIDQEKTVSITVTDLNNNQITIADILVVVRDTLPPSYVINNYTLTIPSSGSGAVFFDDIVGSLADNCTARENLLRYINYEDVDAEDWCGYGHEGGEGENAYMNMAGKATVTGSVAQSGHPVSRVNDDKPAGNTTTSNQTYYSTAQTNGENYVQYNFNSNYNFNAIEVLWASKASNDGNIALSHNDTYMPADSISRSDISPANAGNVRDGNTSTSVSLAAGTNRWIQYHFSQPVVVANCSLRWASNPPADPSVIEYSNDGTTWTSYGTIDNVANSHTTLTINATSSIEYIRLRYSSASEPALAEWYVMGKACTPVYRRDFAPNGTDDIVLLSHIKDDNGFVYVEGLNAYDTNGAEWGLDLNTINDEDAVSGGSCFGTDNFASDWAWVEYDFYDTVNITSTEICWDTYNNQAYPAAAYLSYWNGSGWVNSGYSFSSFAAGSSYSTLSDIDITTTKLRVYFQRRTLWDRGWVYYDVYIYNWRVYGHPCTTATAIPDTDENPIVVSTNKAYLPAANISATSTYSNNNNDYVASNAADGDDDTYWIPNTSNGNWNTFTLTYEFSYEMAITGINAPSWYNFSDNRVRYITYQYLLDGTWTSIDISDVTAANYITTTSVCVNFQAYRSGNTRPGIREWEIRAYPVDISYSGCWKTAQVIDHYDCPTVTTEYPMELPASAVVKYSADGGTTWSEAIVNTSSTTAVGTAEFPGSVNTFNFNSVVTANALRLEFVNSGSSTGIYEWRTFGARIAQGGNDVSACSNFTCADVHTTKPVYFKVTDASGNSVTDSSMVPIIPYFDITTLDIKDCGYTGERYYPAIVGLSGENTYSYTWKEIDDLADNNAHQSLFLRWTDAADDCPSFNYMNGDYTVNWITTYTMPNPGQDWIELNTSGCSNAPHDDDYELPNGTYRVNLKVADDNGCWDDIDYDFEYKSDNSTAVSIDYREVCKGDIETYYIKFTSSWTFWLQEDNTFNWEDFPSDVTVIDGGRSKGENGSTYGDYYVTVQFNNSTVENGGDYTDLQYSYQARGLHLINGVSITSTHIETGTGSRVSGWTLVVLDSLEAGGPYFTAQPSNNVNIPQGTKYVRVNNTNDYTGNNFWYNDYVNCLETRIYRVTVYDVVEPVLEALDSYGDNTWKAAGAIDLCPFDTITYRVKDGLVANDYTSLEWSITDNTTATTGRIIAGGNWYDSTITVVWNDPTKTPTVNVRGFNKLDCSSDITTYEKAIIDNDPPVLDCSLLSQTHDNAPNACQYVFQDLPAPLITDNCHDRIASYRCDIYSEYSDDDDNSNDVSMDDHAADGLRNAAGKYPVGTTYIVWTATDYMGNVGTCYHTVTVVDNEAPRFTRTFADVTKTTDAGACTYTVPANETQFNATAVDNCDGEPDLVATIIKNYDTLNPDTVKNQDTISSCVFPLGNSKVTWVVTDNKNNADTTSFVITVVDREKPVLTGPLASIEAYADAGECSAAVINLVRNSTSNPRDIDYTPTNRDSANAYLRNNITDNCTPSEDIIDTLVYRSDNMDLDEPFAVGTTIMYWKATDESGNYIEKITQNVTILDNQNPYFLADDAAFASMSVGYCSRATFRLPIPVPYDNCTQSSIDNIKWTVTGIGNAYSQTGTITHAQSAAFNPNGDGYTSIIPEFLDIETGSDYIVKWEVTDVYGNDSTSQAYWDTIHVQAKPNIGVLEIAQMTCGNASDGKISINTTVERGYRAETGAIPEYTITNWATSQTSPNFSGLGAGQYTIQMRVNGCYSNTLQGTINALENYSITLSKTDPYCYEDETGSVTLKMDGGVEGQPLFSGTAITAADYDALDNVASSGAIEAWVYLSAHSAGNIVSKSGAYALSIDATGYVSLSVGNTTVAVSAGSDSLSLNRWYYLVGNWTTGNSAVYIDGKSVGTGSGGTASVNDSGVAIGGIKGMVRDVRIWSSNDRNGITNGDHPTTKFTGSESGLVAYWPLNEGSGTTCDNKCPSGNDITINSSLWTTSNPQPGTYKWYKTGNSDSISTNSKGIYNLGLGTYRVVFQDPYGCPGEGLAVSITLDATDNQSPTIGVVNPKVCHADANCQYTVLSTDTDLWPTISDACDYTVTWEVVPELTAAKQVFTGNNDNDPGIEGAVLEHGRNAVKVTVKQNNDRVTSEFSYYITVDDTTRPVIVISAVGEGILNNSNLPMGSGSVEFKAYDLNDGSYDNCTNAVNLKYGISRELENPVFTESVVFDCGDVGDTAQVALRVTDESNNSAISSFGEVKVVDNDPAEFMSDVVVEYQICATKTGTGGAPDYTEITADAGLFIHPVPTTEEAQYDGDYTDNCTVRGVRYKLIHYSDLNATQPDSYGTTEGWSQDNAAASFNGKEYWLDEEVSVGTPFYEGVTEVWYKLYDGWNEGENVSEMVKFRVIVLPRPELDGHTIE